jgi:hypothetical protein
MKLSYIESRELARIREADADPVERAAAFADGCRINTLYMVMRAGSGHVGRVAGALRRPASRERGERSPVREWARPRS